jgi:hypothetical protein
MEQTGTSSGSAARTSARSFTIIEHVTLSVPADADLSLKSIAGQVRIGSTNGMVSLDSIAGHVEVVDLREARMSSLAQGLNMTVSALGDRGITVSTVTGAIDLGVRVASMPRSSCAACRAGFRTTWRAPSRPKTSARTIARCSVAAAQDRDRSRRR